MDLKIGDKFRTKQSAVRDRRESFVATNVWDNGVQYKSERYFHSVSRSDVILPFNTFEYGGPLGSGIRITNPSAFVEYGHLTFKQFAKEWEAYTGFQGADRNGMLIWDVACTATNRDDKRLDPELDALLERWQVRPVARRLIEEDCLVWGPNSSDFKLCYEKFLLKNWACPNCMKPAKDFNQNKAYLQYCSESCYNGEGESDVIDIDKAFKELTEEHEQVKAERDGYVESVDQYRSWIRAVQQKADRLEGKAANLQEQLDCAWSRVRELETHNADGYAELESVKAEKIEISKAKSAMHKRAQKAEGALQKSQVKIEKLRTKLDRAHGRISKIQSESDKQRNALVQAHMKLAEAESPRGLMKKVEAIHEARKGQITSQPPVKQPERNNWIKQIHLRNQRIAELEMVVNEVNKELEVEKSGNGAQVKIAEAKWACIQTGIRSLAGGGVLITLLQYLM